MIKDKFILFLLKIICREHVRITQSLSNTHNINSLNEWQQHRFYWEIRNIIPVSPCELLPRAKWWTVIMGIWVRVLVQTKDRWIFREFKGFKFVHEYVLLWWKLVFNCMLRKISTYLTLELHHEKACLFALPAKTYPYCT